MLVLRKPTAAACATIQPSALDVLASSRTPRPAPMLGWLMLLAHAPAPPMIQPSVELDLRARLPTLRLAPMLVLRKQTAAACATIPPSALALPASSRTPRPALMLALPKPTAAACATMVGLARSVQRRVRQSAPPPSLDQFLGVFPPLFAS